MSKLKQSEIDLTSAINELHWLNFNLGNAMLCMSSNIIQVLMLVNGN